MKPQFVCLAVIHCLIWAFILLAFLSKKTAYMNLYYIIPFVYIIHMFPLHFINEAKRQMYPDDWEQRTDVVYDSMGIPGKFVKLQHKLEDNCFGSPISPQGMLIFGAITSAWVLK